MTMPKNKNFAYISGKRYDGMMGRCYRTGDTSYENYGGRGIAVCSAWIKDINNFRNWLLAILFSMGMSTEEFIAESTKWRLDRINSDGHYTPTNCRLVSNQQSSRNKREVLTKTVKSAEGEMIEIKGGLVE